MSKDVYKWEEIFRKENPVDRSEFAMVQLSSRISVNYGNVFAQIMMGAKGRR